MLKFYLEGVGTDAPTKSPSNLTPSPVLTPGSLPLNKVRATAGGDELREDDRSLRPQSSLISLPLRTAFPRPKKKKRTGSRTRPGAGPPVGDGPPAAGGARRARSPAATLIVTRLQLNRVQRSGGARGASAQRHLGPRARWSCGCLLYTSPSPRDLH